MILFITLFFTSCNYWQDFVFNCVFICICFYRSKTYIFEEFLFTWQDRLRKLDQPTTMSVKLQAEVDKYKVQQSITFLMLPKFLIIYRS